jgi:hypothetical protein
MSREWQLKRDRQLRKRLAQALSEKCEYAIDCEMMLVVLTSLY